MFQTLNLFEQFLYTTINKEMGGKLKPINIQMAPNFILSLFYLTYLIIFVPDNAQNIKFKILLIVS